MSCICLLCGAPIALSFPRLRRRSWESRGGTDDHRRSPVCTECESELVTIRGEVCRRCGRPLISELRLCTACREREASLSNLAALEYRGRPRELISLYKLSGVRSLGTFLGALFVSACGRVLQDSTLVPVPASPERRRLLGWDPVEELAVALAASLNVEVCRLLSRRPGRQQKELGYYDRLENAARLFDYTPVASPGPRTLVLFDDIYTTGATLAVCRQILSDNGFDVSRSFTLAVD